MLKITSNSRINSKSQPEYFECSKCGYLAWYLNWTVQGIDFYGGSTARLYEPGKCPCCNEPFYTPEVWAMIQVMGQELSFDDICKLADLC